MIKIRNIYLLNYLVLLTISIIFLIILYFRDLNYNIRLFLANKDFDIIEFIAFIKTV